MSSSFWIFCDKHFTLQKLPHWFHKGFTYIGIKMPLKIHSWTNLLLFRMKVLFQCMWHISVLLRLPSNQFRTVIKNNSTKSQNTGNPIFRFPFSFFLRYRVSLRHCSLAVAIVFLTIFLESTKCTKSRFFQND